MSRRTAESSKKRKRPSREAVVNDLIRLAVSGMERCRYEPTVAEVNIAAVNLLRRTFQSVIAHSPKDSVLTNRSEMENVLVQLWEEFRPQTTVQ